MFIWWPSTAVASMCRAYSPAWSCLHGSVWDSEWSGSVLHGGVFRVGSSGCSSRDPGGLARCRPGRVAFGARGLGFLGPRIWGCLSNELKSAESLNTFKRLIAQWDGPMCKCNACRFTVNNVQTV